MEKNRIIDMKDRHDDEEQVKKKSKAIRVGLVGLVWFICWRLASCVLYKRKFLLTQRANKNYHSLYSYDSFCGHL